MARRMELASVAGTVKYVFPYNPVSFDAIDDYAVSEIETIHGPCVYQRPIFDSRLRVMSWKGNWASDTNMVALISNLQARIGKTYYIAFHSVAPIVHVWPYSTLVSGTGWWKVKIVDLKTKIKDGGRLVYDSVDLYLSPQS